MRNTLKGFVIGVLSTTLLVSTVAYAKTGAERIEAIYKNIKIYVDGIKIDPKDANGDTVEPFIYNGTTYLPVRAVGEAIGKSVTWDGTTQSVYLGKVPGQTQNWMDVCKPYEVNGTLYLTEENNYFTMSGTEYTNGFVLHGGPTIYKPALFNLNGRFNSVTFKVGLLDDDSKYNNVDADLTVYLDGTPVHRETLKWDAGTKTITIPLNGAMHMKIETCGNNTYYGFADGVFE